MSRHRKAPRSGFIPYYIEDNEVFIMLMKPSDPKFGGDEFQLAKGKVENGETRLEAGLREANEEIGLGRHNLKSIEFLGTYLGYTSIFYGEVIDTTDFSPTTYETGEVTWMSTSKFFKEGRSIHRPIVRDFMAELEAMGLFPQNH